MNYTITIITSITTITNYTNIIFTSRTKKELQLRLCWY